MRAATAVTEALIRPMAFDAGKQEALEHDLEWLRQRRGDFIEVACPACRSDRRHLAFTKYGFAFVGCSDCATVYMSPRATPEILQEFYAGSALYAYWNRHIFPASEAARRDRLFKPRVQRVLELCRRHGIATGTLVEVGAANGLFCQEALASSAFRRVIAVEPGRALAETCRQRGVETIESAVEELRSVGNVVDVIASFETIEHLFSPAVFLDGCRRLLAPGGLIVVTCPNYLGFDIQALGTASDSLDAEHINLFNPMSLQRLFERSGFEVLECTTPGELDAELVHKKCLGGELDLTGQPLLKTLLLDRWDELGAPFQAFLKANRLSSHMWLAARRSA